MRISQLLMGTIIGASLVFLGITLSANANDHAEDMQTIKTIEHKIVVAKTTDEVMQYCDKDIVLYDVMTPLQYVGYKAVRDHLQAIFYGKGPKDIKVDFLSLNVLADGNLGVAYSIQHFAWKESGKARETTVRQTDVYRKSGGEWKLIQSHISVPIDPNTGQAQMNLGL